MKTSTFSIQDCEKHFRKYVRRKSDTDSHYFDTTKLRKISETNNTHGDIVLKNKKLCRESRQSIIEIDKKTPLRSCLNLFVKLFYNLFCGYFLV